jgi:hypothetical protein
MPTQPYFVDGEKVASVTTILSRWKDSGGLIYWAWDQGRKGLDYRETRDKAADAGTLAHGMLEADIRKKKFIPNPGLDKLVLAQARHAFAAYLEWKLSSAVTTIRTEVPLVSREHNFGGTLDAIRVGESRRLTDWKTSAGVYTEMLLQVAGGYSILWAENFPDEPLDGIEILRFSKPEQPDDPVSFHHHFWGKAILPIAQKQFLLLKDAYYLDKRLKGLL